jgi:ribonucleotide reductase beta subunit family protein with ferritin-like domain
MENSYSDSEEAIIYKELNKSHDSDLDNSRASISIPVVNTNISENDISEPLLTETQRYTLHPIKYPAIWDMYKKQQASFWIASEVDLSKDKPDWKNKLSENERFFVKHILAFFAGSDGIVGVNILDNFSKDVKILEAQFTYSFQGTMEAIHSEMYSLMIDTYIDDADEKDLLFNAIEKIPCIAKKAQWALRWTCLLSPGDAGTCLLSPGDAGTCLLSPGDAGTCPLVNENNGDAGTCHQSPGLSLDNPNQNMFNNNSFAKRLLAFAIVEGLFFSGAFCSIYWLKQKGILPGLTKSNEFIARDERLHTEFACLLYSMIKNRLDQSEVYEMIEEAVQIETEFITQSLPVKLIGMNSDLMTQYIKYVADWLLTNLNYSKKYNVKNPFSFMNTIGMESRSNFFDERASTYQKAHVFNASKELTETDDF